MNEKELHEAYASLYHLYTELDKEVNEYARLSREVPLNKETDFRLGVIKLGIEQSRFAIARQEIKLLNGIIARKDKINENAKLLPGEIGITANSLPDEIDEDTPLPIYHELINDDERQNLFIQGIKNTHSI